jgi:hypothetical protein
MEFNQRMQDFEDEFSKLVADFVDVYPTLITAQAMALGDMFNRDDFPSPSDVAHRFDFRLNYMPVPTAGDFRVDVGNDAEKELREKLSKLADERIGHAMRDVKARLKEHLDRMSDRLGSDVVGGVIQTRKFHDSLLDTAFELCDMVKALNITNDPDLEAARKELATTIQGLDVQDLRKNVPVRNDVKASVDAIRSKFSF